MARTVCVVLVLSLLCNSTPAAAQTIVGVTQEWRVSFAFWLHAGGRLAELKRRLTGQDLPDAKPQERQTDRDARVRRLRISPGDVTARIGETVRFVAVANDEESDTIGGVKFAWSVQGNKEDVGGLISPNGEFSSPVDGKFKISVEGAGQTAQTTVTVLEGAPITKGPRLKVKDLSTRDLPSPTLQQGARGGDTAPRRDAPTRRDAKSIFFKTSFRSAESPATASTASPLPAGSDQYGWNDGNYMTADDPGSQPGNPPGSPLDDGAGNGNFQIAAPVASLQGRGINVSLALAYNAHLWHKAGSNITYDIDKGWPAPGWSLGFGKMEDIGDGGSIIIDADGTRHGFNGSIFGPIADSSFSGQTTDGSFINYSCVRSGGVIIYGSATLPNGTNTVYGAPGDGAIYPTLITDPNGNYVTVTYRNNSGPQIDTVSDTLGRAISFQYDGNNLLTAVTAPGLNTSGTLTLIRLHYQQQFIGASFSGLTRLVRNTSPWLLDAIYYPATGTGYWCGDSDSFLSSYGMMAKVVEQRGMTLSSGGLNDMGTVTPGTMTTQSVYSWQTSASNAPTYTSVSETWAGMDSGPAVTTYIVNENASPRTTTVILPNGTKSLQYSYNASGQFNDGLIYKDETYDTDGTTLLSRSEVTWALGDYNSPRPTLTTVTTRQGTSYVTTGTEFNYAQSPSFNQVTEVRNYDYGYVSGGSNTLLRKTVTDYENSSNYTNRHIFNLPKIVSVYAGDGATRVSRTEYTYDGGPLQDTPGVVQHSDQFNPYAPVVNIPGHWETHCSGCPPCSCIPVWIPPSTQTAYRPETNYRGNLTQVKSYADATTLNEATSVAETRTYDIDGNVVKASTSCCQQTSVTFTAATKYAYAESQTRGSATDGYAQVTTSATYDYNTGLILSATDANGRISQTSYSSATLRPQTASLPTGAHTDYAYDDNAMTVTQSTYLASGAPDNGALAEQTIKSLNGRGQVRWEQALGASGVWDYVQSVYNNMGQITQQSRPYRSGETQYWTTTNYDALGRTTRVTTPDGSTTESYYNQTDFDPNDSYVPTRPNVASSSAGDTVLVKDAWGRERWGRTDVQGRLVEIVEPNPSGNGSVATSGLVTTYSYNTVGNLTTVNQGAQTRSFRYDSLGRLTAQKLAETSATLSDSGQYVGAGTWSDVFAYDNLSKLTSHTDARGVKTVYNYNGDPLNRLQSVSWDTSGFGDTANPILPAATVTYQYRTKGSPTELKDVTQLSSVSTAGVSTESYVYDTEGRLSTNTLTLTSRSSYPLVTDYSFDTLDRVYEVLYPAEYGNGQQPRKVVHHNYDVASRLSALSVNGANQASGIVYNAASQTTALNVGQSGPNQIVESYNYDPQTGLLGNQTLARAGAPATWLLNLSYDYAGSNGKRTGQLTKILNNLNHNKDRGYTYDALGRLTQASGGSAGASIWSQAYVYDRYGNRTSVIATGNTAKLEKPQEPRPALPTDQLALNSAPVLPETFGADARDVSDSPGGIHLPPSRIASATAGRSLAPNPQGGPPVFTDDPLTPGVTIKAVHVTELRSAVNQARALGGLSAASWTDSSLTGVWIQAVHILELRTRLAEARAALGLPVAVYADPNLAPGTPIRAVHVQELRDRVKEALNASTLQCLPGQTLLIAQFVKNFYQGALARQPNSAELQTWTGQLRQAYNQGQAQEIATATYMGRQLFKSQEYANRGRDNHWFVYDLYWAYLQRDPDSGGWSSWESAVNTNGRDYVRAGFDQSSEFATKVGTLCPGSTGSPAPIPTDGLTSLAFDPLTNRISTTGFQYDAAGNQTRIVRADGSAQKFQYDAANRLIRVSDDYNITIQTFTYGDDNQRLVTQDGDESSNYRTYYATGGDSVIAEYRETPSSLAAPQWSRSYIYLGARLLSTLEPNGSGGEATRYHHPDRLGTRVVTTAAETNPIGTTAVEQVALPFGTPLDNESTGATGRRFISYDRSAITGLDYALNRHYDQQQGRFTQVDPIGMDASSLDNPQSLNLYAYCGNDPVNKQDPDGLFFGKLFHWIGKALKILSIVALVVMTMIVFAPASSFAFKGALWMFFHVLLPLSHIPGLGEFVPVGMMGSPQWNPNSRSMFGNGWQDQGQTYTCPNPPNCQDVIPPLPPVSAGNIYANYSAWEKIKWGLNIGADKALTVVVGFADNLTWNKAEWGSKKFGSFLAGQDVSKQVEMDRAERRSSWYYTGGEGLAVAWDFAFGEEAVVYGAKVLGWGGKLAVHAAHHTFRFGRFSHLQLDLWKVGVKASHLPSLRIPLFIKRWPLKEIVIRKF